MYVYKCLCLLQIQCRERPSDFPGIKIVLQSLSLRAQRGGADFSLRRPLYTAQAHPEQSLSCSVLVNNLDVLVGWGPGLDLHVQLT